MAFRLRIATPDDLAAVLPRTHALNADEGITVDDVELEAAMRTLLADSSLGGVWVIEDTAIIGHVIVTYGYDLEFAGRDAWLTELWIDPPERGRGAATAALAALDTELRGHHVRALHLQVRPDNPALRLYERTGFERSPRLVMTRRM